MTMIHGRGQYVPTDHGRLYLEVEGHGPPVVIVPGGPGVGHAHYHPWFSRLADTHQVIYFDYVGTGRSDRLADPRGYSIALFAAGIEAVRRHLGHDTISLLGVSFGGMPALAYCTEHRDRVAAIVLSNGQMSAATWQRGNIDHVNAGLREHFPERWERLLDLRARGTRSLDAAYGELLEPVVDACEWAARDPSARPRLHRDDVDGLRLDVYAAVCGDDPEWTVGGTMAGFDPLPELAGRRLPALVATGRWDGMVTPALARVAVEALGDTARMHTFEHSAHRPWAEEPDSYFDVVGRFLLDHATR
jgi:proline iminopeptidase